MYLLSIMEKFFVLLSFLATTSTTFCNAQERISPQTLYDGIQNGLYDAIIDVRTQGEWDSTGHIINATLIESLQLLSESDELPSELLSCQGPCYTIVIYCQSGNRAGQAINLLKEKFKGFEETTMYNGLGVSQWQQSGYELVKTPSKLLQCPPPVPVLPATRSINTNKNSTAAAELLCPKLAALAADTNAQQQSSQQQQQQEVTTSTEAKDINETVTAEMKEEKETSNEEESPKEEEKTTQNDDTNEQSSASGSGDITNVIIDDTPTSSTLSSLMMPRVDSLQLLVIISSACLILLV